MADSGIKDAATRERQLTSVLRTFDRGLEELSFASNGVQQLRSLADAIKTFDATLGHNTTKRLDERYAGIVEKEINQSKFTDAERVNIDAALTALEARNSDRARPLREAFLKRLGGWEVVTQLVAPFENMTDVFRNNRVTTRSNHLSARFQEADTVQSETADFHLRETTLSKTKRLQAIEFSFAERRLETGVLLLVRQTATRIFHTNSALRVSERVANVLPGWMLSGRPVWVLWVKSKARWPEVRH